MKKSPMFNAKGKAIINRCRIKFGLPKGSNTLSVLHCFLNNTPGYEKLTREEHDALMAIGLHKMFELEADD